MTFSQTLLTFDDLESLQKPWDRYAVKSPSTGFCLIFFSWLDSSYTCWVGRPLSATFITSYVCEIWAGDIIIVDYHWCEPEHLVLQCGQRQQLRRLCHSFPHCAGFKKWPCEVQLEEWGVCVWNIWNFSWRFAYLPPFIYLFHNLFLWLWTQGVYFTYCIII